VLGKHRLVLLVRQVELPAEPLDFRIHL
jgi:hypothetical protein